MNDHFDTKVDVFQSMPNDPPPRHFHEPHARAHPVFPRGAKQNTEPPVIETTPLVFHQARRAVRPIPTNKFWANFMLANQNKPVWTQPYSITWMKGIGRLKSYGMGISHAEGSQRVFGPRKGNGAAEFYTNPTGRSIIVSALDLNWRTLLLTDSHTEFSCNVNLVASHLKFPTITFPVVLGMGFVTALFYDSSGPLIQSEIGLSQIVGPMPISYGIQKYRLYLKDGTNWNLYAWSMDGTSPIIHFKAGDLPIVGGFRGTIQIAKVPPGASDETLDVSAGVYVFSTVASGYALGTAGWYMFTFQKAGRDLSKPLLMYALPHHVESFDESMAGSMTDYRLDTPTKGVAVGIFADEWTMVEKNLPIDMGLYPWSPSNANPILSSNAIAAIKCAAQTEVEEDMHEQVSLDSLYFSGKGFAKWAMMACALDLADLHELRDICVEKLKEEFSLFARNQHTNPLQYDETFGGIVLEAGLKNPMMDFGNALYNYHHFHYGSFVYAAAVLATFDPVALFDGWGNSLAEMLLRDFASPTTDKYFSASRSFDWWHGHSWATGVVSMIDGKDQGSFSEDTFASYAVMMYGRACGNKSLQARGALMLAIQRRTLNAYVFMKDDNQNQPGRFIRNRVPGILYENKCHHTTYFGDKDEFIQGVNMIPVAAHSAYTRQPEFVEQEWKTYFDNGREEKIDDGWRGVVKLNQSIIDPAAAFAFFSAPDFEKHHLAPGQSRTWSLAYSAALGGAPVLPN